MEKGNPSPLFITSGCIQLFEGENYTTVDHFMLSLEKITLFTKFKIIKIPTHLNLKYLHVTGNGKYN